MQAGAIKSECLCGGPISSNRNRQPLAVCYDGILLVPRNLMTSSRKALGSSAWTLCPVLTTYLITARGNISRIPGRSSALESKVYTYHCQHASIIYSQMSAKHLSNNKITIRFTKTYNANQWRGVRYFYMLFFNEICLTMKLLGLILSLKSQLLLCKKIGQGFCI